MTEQDDELKNLFQQKNREDAFTPDEQNWEKMAAIIKNERSSKRRFFVYFSLVFILGSIGWFFVEKTVTKPSMVAVKPQHNGSKTKEATTPISEESAPKTIDNHSQEKNQTKKESYNAKKVDASSIPAKESSYNKPILKSSTSEQEKTNNATVTKSKHTVEKIKTITPKETIPTEVPIVFDTANVYETRETIGKSTDPIIAKKAQEKKPTTVPKATDETEKNENNANEEKPIATPFTKTELSNNQNNNLNKQSQPQKETVNSDFTEIQKEEKLLADNLTMKKILVPAERPDFTIAAIVPIRDSVSPKKLLSHRIFLEAGINYNLGWNTNNQKEANGFNPLFGLQYYRDLSKRAGFSVGLIYSTINHLSATSHTSTTTHLKFGEEVDATVVSAQNMHYLLIPLKLNYSLSKNDFAFIGYTIAYLLDVDSKIETYNTRLNYTSTPVVSKSMGYTKGFSPYDGQITIGYRRRLYKECYLNGELFYGLQDIKNNDVYKSKEYERAYGFRLSIGINLWKK
jgi:hypothetical protein